MDEAKSAVLTDTKKKYDENTIFNVKWLASTTLAIWPWLLASIIVCLIFGNLYLRYSTPIYRSYAELLINDSKRGGSSNQDDVMQLLKNSHTKVNVENEVEILKSRTLMLDVVRALNLNVNYTVTGRFKRTNIYATRPFDFYVGDSSSNSYSCKVNIINENEYELLEKSGKKIRGRWDDTIITRNGKAVLVKAASFQVSPLQINVLVVPELDAAKKFMRLVSLGVPSKASSCLNLGMMDEIPERSVDVLNTLMAQYKSRNINIKRTVADLTTEFIDGRLAIVFEELTGVEDSITNLKQRRGIADINVAANIAVSGSTSQNEKLAEIEVQIELMKSLESIGRRATDDDFYYPSSIVTEGAVTELIGRFNRTTADIQASQVVNTASNPITKLMYEQRKKLKEDIATLISANLKELEYKASKIKDKLNKFNSKINEAPVVQRIYLDYARKQAIKQDLFIFLLKKREDILIERSSTVADAMVIDPAITDPFPVNPNHSRILTMSLLFGALIPFGFILIRRALNIKVISKSDIMKVSDVPVIGEIGNNGDGENIAVEKNSRTLISEQFRALRTNLQYMLPGEDKKVLMVTSSMSNEGKSFISVNLAITFALSGKKVVLLEFDLRKPRVSRMLGLDNSNGYTNYAIGKTSYEDIIVPSGFEENLYIIPSGPIPPNPAELILLERTDELFRRLKEDFDYIFIDTSPIGLVTDAQLLYKFANITLYILRQGHTHKQQLQIANDLYATGKMPHIGFIVNDVIASRGFAYGYGYEENYGYGSGYGYGYGYGYGLGYGSYGGGYYINEKKKGIFGLFNKNKK